MNVRNDCAWLPLGVHVVRALAALPLITQIRASCFAVCPHSAPHAGLPRPHDGSGE